MAGKADSWPMTATAAVKQRAAGAQVKPSAAVQSLRGLEALLGRGGTRLERLVGGEVHHVM